MLNKIIFTLFLAALCMRPFLPAFTYPKEDILLSLYIIAISILLFLSNAGAGIKPGSRLHSAFRRQDKAILISLCIYFAAILVSTFFSKDTDISLSNFYKYAACLFVFIAVLGLTPEKQKMLALLLLANSCLVSMRAIQWFIGGTFSALDYMSYHGISWNFAVEFLSRARAFMPFMLPNDLAGYLILFIPLAIALLFQKNEKAHSRLVGLSVKNIYFLLVALSTVIVLLSTQSLGAIASLLAAVIIFGFIQKKNNIKNKFTVIAALFFASVFVLMLLLRLNNPHEFNHPLFSLNERLSYWRHAVSVIRQHPFTGVGPGNYPFFKSLWAHNAYLQAWAETGPLGLVGLVGIATATLRINFNNISAGDNKRFIRSLWVGNLAFLIHNMVEITFFRPEISLQWWVFAAILCAAHTKYKK